MVIWCYDASGTLCEDFGDIDPVTGPKGFAVHDVLQGAGGISLAIDPSGRILVAGYGSESGYPDMVIWRYDSNGQLDHIFGDEITPTVRAGFAVHNVWTGGTMMTWAIP